MLPALTTGMTTRRSGEITDQYYLKYLRSRKTCPGTPLYLYSAGTGLDCGGRTGDAGLSFLYPMGPDRLSVTRRVRTSAAASGDSVGETGSTVAVRSVSTTGTKKYSIILKASVCLINSNL